VGHTHTHVQTHTHTHTRTPTHPHTNKPWSTRSVVKGMVQARWRDPVAHAHTHARTHTHTHTKINTLTRTHTRTHTRTNASAGHDPGGAGGAARSFAEVSCARLHCCLRVHYGKSIQGAHPYTHARQFVTACVHCATRTHKHTHTHTYTHTPVLFFVWAKPTFGTWGSLGHSENILKCRYSGISPSPGPTSWGTALEPLL